MGCILGAPEKFENKKFAFNFLVPIGTPSSRTSICLVDWEERLREELESAHMLREDLDSQAYREALACARERIAMAQADEDLTKEPIQEISSRIPTEIRNTLLTHTPHIPGKNMHKTSGQNMTRNASKQGNFGSLVAIYLPCMWGLGLQKESPRESKSEREGI